MNDKPSIVAAALAAGILGACLIALPWWAACLVALLIALVGWRFPQLGLGYSSGLVVNKSPSSSRPFSITTMLPFVVMYTLVSLTITFASDMNDWVYLLIPVWMTAGGFYGWAARTNSAGKPITLPSDSPAMLVHLGQLSAYDGTLVKIWRLAQLLDQPEDTVINDAKALQRDGLVSISTMGFSDNPREWSVQLQPKAYEHLTAAA